MVENNLKLEAGARSRTRAPHRPFPAGRRAYFFPLQLHGTIFPRLGLRLRVGGSRLALSVLRRIAIHGTVRDDCYQSSTRLVRLLCNRFLSKFKLIVLCETWKENCRFL
jgi:hypothetical protein